MREYLEYFVVKFFIILTRFLPKSWIYALMEKASLFIYLTLKRRRSLTIDNLKLAFPDLTQKEAEKLAKDVYKNLSQTVAEILLILNDRFDIDAAIINKDEFCQKVAPVMQKSTNGVIFTSPHFGNWELLGHFFAKNVKPVKIIGRKGDNHLIEEKITKPFREKYKNSNIHKNEAMGPIVKELRKNGVVGLLLDQKISKTNGIVTQFFGRDCYTTTSIANLKLKYNSTVLPIFIIRQERGKYNIIFEPDVSYMGEDKDTKEEKVRAMTQRYNDIYEKVIKKYPEQWFWMHNRWKL